MTRIFARLSAVAILAAAGLVHAAPAQAATLTTDVFCEALGRYSVFCERTIAGGVAPFKTRWYYNGNYFPSQDDKAYTSWGCSTGIANKYKVVVYDATGASATDTSQPICRTGLP